MNKYKIIITNIGLLVIFLLVPLNLAAHTEDINQLKEIIDAHNSGISTAVTILTVMVMIILASGYAVYIIIKNKIVDETRSKILENESRNLIRLGVRDYENHLYAKKAGQTDSSLSCLYSARSHTQQARYMASSMSNPLSYHPKNDLLALSGTNLAYYYTELMLITDEIKSRDFMRKQAMLALEESSINLASSVKRQATTDALWFDMIESSIFTQYHCLNEASDDSSFFQGELEIVMQKLNDITYHNDVPQSFRSQTLNDWGDIIKKYNGKESN